MNFDRVTGKLNLDVISTWTLSWYQLSRDTSHNNYLKLKFQSYIQIRQLNENIVELWTQLNPIASLSYPFMLKVQRVSRSKDNQISKGLTS